MKLKHLVFFCGPNHRSETTLIEMLLEFSRPDLAAIAASVMPAREHVVAALRGAGVVASADDFTAAAANTGPLEQFGRWCCTAALLMQRQAGHDVGMQRVLVNEHRRRSTALFEHEESQVGERAGRLALHLVANAVPGLEKPVQRREHEGPFGELFLEFRAFAEGLVQPRDTRAIIGAARRAKIPFIKLERDPYDPVKGDFRIRYNSMLMLGHSARRQIIDGTFALEKSAAAVPLLFERSPAMQTVARAGLPVPRHDRDFLPCRSLARARRSARTIGYPLVAKPARRQSGKGVTLNIADSEALAGAAAAAMELGHGILVEGFADGETSRLIVANHRVVGVSGPENAETGTARIHPSTVQAAQALSRALRVGLLVLTVVSRDISQKLEDNGGVVVDLEIAPELDRFLPPGSPLLDAAADGFIQWLFPPGIPARIPVLAVTGTNGKTTTSRMIARITQAAGQTTGLICTDGRYIGETLLEEGDQGALMGHYRLFESKQVETAVFETHHRGIAVYGFAFDHCDVAVCTNVTDDHIGEYGIETVAEMAVLKRSLLERAFGAVVLNADDEHCRAMIPHLAGRKICLFSLASRFEDLRGQHGDDGCSCVVEPHEGAGWITIHDGGRRIPVVAVDHIPATYAGTAAFNTSNAQAATLAAWLHGIPAADIRAALAGFSSGFDATPGRLNEFRGLPCRVIVDFAHNPDGVRKIAEFVGRLDIPGNRFIAWSGWKSDDHVRATARAAAGYFDRYICKNYTPVPGEPHTYPGQPNRVPDLMKAALVEAGVDENRIDTFTDETDAIRHALDTAGEGDLVMLLLGYQGMTFIRALLEDRAARQ